MDQWFTKNPIPSPVTPAHRASHLHPWKTLLMVQNWLDVVAECGGWMWWLNWCFHVVVVCYNGLCSECILPTEAEIFSTAKTQAWFCSCPSWTQADESQSSKFDLQLNWQCCNQCTLHLNVAYHHMCLICAYTCTSYVPTPHLQLIFHGYAPYPQEAANLLQGPGSFK